MLEALLVSTTVVAIAEIGDKTQLLALVLATRYRAPWAILAGILIATLANHALAGVAGHLAAQFVPDHILRWVLAAGFIGMGLWVLIPDKLDDDEARQSRRFGPFLTALVVFFWVEMGDKTQIATVALAAKFDALVPVVVGTTVGMMLANAPVVMLGHFAGHRLPLKLIHALAAVLFIALGVWVAVVGL